jgi:glycerophosphoryl diester phosphodiesterase
MRSSPSGADPLDPGPAGFAHRGLHGGPDVPENSMPAFAAAIELGAGIECDLRLTADDRIVVFHDADARRSCGSPLRIRESTLEQVSRLRVGGCPVPTLESLLALVGGRVPLLLEAKVDRDVRRWVPALRRDLAGYAGRFGVMSFDPRLARLLKGAMPHVLRGLVLRDTLPAAQRSAAMWLADPKFLSVERPSLGKAWVRRARTRMPVHSWTIRTQEERAQAAVHADALIWEGDGRPRN